MKQNATLRQKRLNAFIIILVIIVASLFGAMIPAINSMLLSIFGWGGSIGGAMLLNATLGLTIAFGFAYLWRIIHRKQIRLAMQSLGYELCLSCGYWLKGLDDATDRCPECGTKRKPLPEPAPEEHDPLT